MTNDETIVYDVEEAAARVAERTGLKVEQIEEVLEAEFLFNSALGFYEIPDDEEGQEFMAEVRKLRKEHSDLLPPVDEEIVDYDDLEDKLVAFIARLTEAETEMIETILDEHIFYLEEKGILEPVEDD